jgi:hypothetical protein
MTLAHRSQIGGNRLLTGSMSHLYGMEGIFDKPDLGESTGSAIVR